MHEKPTESVGEHSARSGAPPEIVSDPEIVTVPLRDDHLVSEFACSKSERVTRFLQVQASDWVALRYCGVFILTLPDDPTRVLGYYTLSQYVLSREEMVGRHKRSHTILNVPLVLIGFMGKQDGAEPGVGAALLVDAARRVYRSDIPAWGLAVEPEGGLENKKLWDWYIDANFVAAKTKAGLMYAPCQSLMSA